MAGRLTPQETLRLLGEVSRILREEGDPAVAVRRASRALVPHAADRVAVYAVDVDGRLVAVAESGDRAPTPAVRDTDFPASAVQDPEPLAALAYRRNEPAFIVSDGDGERVITGPPTGDAPVHRLAVPLVRTEGTVGALELEVEPEDPRGFTPEDLEHVGMIGDRMSLALENLRLRREVQEARRAKSDFLSVVSHELRTPLTAVVGYADLMAAGIPGPVTEDQGRQLERIKENAWNLLELIDGILGYVRRDGDGSRVVVGPVQPVRIVDDAVEPARSAARAKGLDLSVELADDLPTLRTDLEKAVRILRHLVSNAVKFTDAGEIAVRVTAGDGRVDFAVTDTGPGLAGAERARVFEPFWQGERVETRTKGGTGMGLSTADRLAELLSGEILVESRVGRGSTFVLRLPVGGPHPLLS